MNFSNEEGISLVEILAVILLLSIIGVLLFSILTQSGRTYNQQTNHNQKMNDAAYVFKMLTKEMRKNPHDIYVPSDNSSANEITIKQIKYHFIEEEQTIFKDDVPFVRNIQSFIITENSDGQLQIQMTHIDHTEFTTTIYIRK